MKKGETGMRKNIVTVNSEMDLKSQIVTSSWGVRRAGPYVFT